MRSIRSLWGQKKCAPFRCIYLRFHVRKLFLNSNNLVNNTQQFKRSFANKLLDERTESMLLGDVHFHRTFHWLNGKHHWYCCYTPKMHKHHTNAEHCKNGMDCEFWCRARLALGVRKRRRRVKSIRSQQWQQQQQHMQRVCICVNRQRWLWAMKSGEMWQRSERAWRNTIG